MRYLLTDTLNFGRYRGYSLKEIFCGWNSPSEEFYKEFIRDRLQGADLFETVGTNETGVLKIIGTEFLNNRQIRIDYEKSPSYSFDTILNYFNVTLFAVEHYPLKAYYDSANDFIIRHNKNNNDEYQIFADPQYLFWCFKKIDRVFVSEQDFDELIKMECTVFEGIYLTAITPNIFNINVRLSKGKIKIDQKAKEANTAKYYSFLEDNAEDDNDWEPSYEEYGGAYGYDDDTINSAFDGDPENYWNID